MQAVTVVSLVSRLCWYYHHKRAVQLGKLQPVHSVISQRHGGIFPDYYSSTVSVGSIRCYHVSAHLPICLCQKSSEQTTNDFLSQQQFVMYMNDINIPEYMDFRNKCATNVGQWYIHTHNYSLHVGHCHDQCGACSGSLKLYIQSM